ncbi:MAG: HPP family protein [Candidatus Omnitrophica bacterium]|nr:HPP family protein [Candidatus Omnitrophota bacterium]
MSAMFKLKTGWKNYVLQSFFATLVIFAILLLLSLRRAVIAASLGATAFILFTLPNDFTAQPRNVIGGHLIGVISGSLFNLIIHYLPQHSAALYAMAVGFSIFFMVITDTEHPPASGTALGIVMFGSSARVVLEVMASVIALSMAHHFLKNYIKDLR